jgi:D-alanine-D-alanine ligase
MKTIAVIFGGKSTEHDVSVITALANVIPPLRLTGKYDVLPVYITKEGTWYADPSLGDISLFSSGKIEAILAKMPPVQLRFDDGLTFTWPRNGLRATTEKHIDLAFPAMHGTNGEDGTLMGLLEMASVPYVGCGQPASVLAMDKILAKQVTTAAGVSTSPWVAATRTEVQADIDTVVKRCENLRYPLFVKPPHLGSSIGITRATDERELRNGLELAAHYDDKVLIEQGVQNLIEVTLPIMGNDEPRPALLERPLLHAEDFFDFDTKYMNGGKKGGKKGGKATSAQGYSELPADLPKKLYDKAVTIGLDVYKALGCSGTARVDMLIDSKLGEVYFNEVNPLPGSLYAHNWRAAGVSGVELVEALIGYAEERWQTRKSQTTTFATSYLKQF